MKNFGTAERNQNIKKTLEKKIEMKGLEDKIIV